MASSRYDEDLTKNRMYLAIKADFPEVLDEAVQAGWVICLPKTPSLDQVTKHGPLLEDQHFIMRHILVPTECSDGTQFRSLVDRRVSLKGSSLVVSSPLSLSRY